MDEEGEDESEYVVLKGNRVHHNGDVYKENQTIPVYGADAERLIKLGIIANISELRERLLTTASGVSVTSE